MCLLTYCYTQFIYSVIFWNFGLSMRCDHYVASRAASCPIYMIFALFICRVHLGVLLFRTAELIPRSPRSPPLATTASLGGCSWLFLPGVSFALRQRI